MESKRWQIAVLKDLLEAVAHIVWIKRPAITPTKHIVRLYISLSKQPAVLALILLQREEQLSHFRKQRKTTVTALTLSLVLLHLAAHLDHSMLYCKDIIFKVDAVPLQAKQFAASQTVNNGNPNHRIQRFIFRNRKQSVKLLCSIKTCLLPKRKQTPASVNVIQLIVFPLSTKKPPRSTRRLLYCQIALVLPIRCD